MRQEHEDEDRSAIVQIFGKTNPPRHEKRLHHHYMSEDDLSRKRKPPPGIAVGQTTGASARPRDRENIYDYRWKGLLGFSSLVFKFSETTSANTFNSPVTFTGDEYTSPHEMNTYRTGGQDKGLSYLGSYFFYTDVPGGHMAALRPMPGVNMKLNNIRDGSLCGHERGGRGGGGGRSGSDDNGGGGPCAPLSPCTDSFFFTAATIPPPSLKPDCSFAGFTDFPPIRITLHGDVTFHGVPATLPPPAL
eukprot:CAMPEP_0185759316 /NCGR_PEP_ID=MMETSP1174-20130828/18069_1 /TAXON_ID=35687 /ORGANISM="Dictyocha speculum, Strain CCMP1381" /LENGTH=246 /DNA_ID=CAMNT_0028439611 /DNA_START=35 /DNA_END=776 /DNA_ORIENTATION=+